MVWLVLGLILFLGVHSIRMFLPGLREVFWSSWGENAWKGIYSVVSIIGLVLLIWGYSQARNEASIVYIPAGWAGSISAFLMLPALILMMAGNLPVGRIKVAVLHPFTLAVVIWSAAHLLANGDSASVTMFGAFFVWSTLLYFMARNRGVPEFGDIQLRFDVIALLVGFGLYLLLVLWAHQWLFGVAPILG